MELDSTIIYLIVFGLLEKFIKNIYTITLNIINLLYIREAVNT